MTKDEWEEKIMDRNLGRQIECAATAAHGGHVYNAMHMRKLAGYAGVGVNADRAMQEERVR